MIGYVLGSGAARGYAHIGAIDVLESEGIKPDLVVGCSIGAVIGALYCSGIPSDELIELALDLNVRKLIRLVVPHRLTQAAINLSKIERFFEEIFPVKTFEDLKIPLRVVATSLTTGKLKVFDKGPLLPPVLASIAIPIIFPAVKYDNEYLVDGGLLSPLPVKIAREWLNNGKIIAINLSGEEFSRAISPDEDPPNIYLTALASVELMQLGLTLNEMPYADIVISPELSDFAFYDFHRAEEIIDAGRTETEKRIEEIKSIL